MLVDRDMAAIPPGNLNARSSYLPPQTAAPEVRAARYRVIDNARQPSNNDQYGRQGQHEYAKLAPGQMSLVIARANSMQRSPMKPIVEAKRSFLPSEPSGYNYNAGSTRPAARQARRQTARRTVVKRAPARMQRQVSRRVSRDGSVTVAPGDTLYSIGRRHNVSVMKLMELNDLSDSSLKCWSADRFAQGGRGVQSLPIAPPQPEAR